MHPPDSHDVLGGVPSISVSRRALAMSRQDAAHAPTSESPRHSVVDRGRYKRLAVTLTMALADPNRQGDDSKPKSDWTRASDGET